MRNNILEKYSRNEISNMEYDEIMEICRLSWYFWHDNLFDSVLYRGVPSRSWDNAFVVIGQMLYLNEIIMHEVEEKPFPLHKINTSGGHYLHFRLNLRKVEKELQANSSLLVLIGMKGVNFLSDLNDRMPSKPNFDEDIHRFVSEYEQKQKGYGDSLYLATSDLSDYVFHALDSFQKFVGY